MKKCFANIQPQTPHNTTQFIVNTGFYPSEHFLFELDCFRSRPDLSNDLWMGTMIGETLKSCLRISKLFIVSFYSQELLMEEMISAVTILGNLPFSHLMKALQQSPTERQTTLMLLAISETIEMLLINLDES
jgi:hypothetical protein